jgi:hypothetical protein
MVRCGRIFSQMDLRVFSVEIFGGETCSLVYSGTIFGIRQRHLRDISVDIYRIGYGTNISPRVSVVLASRARVALYGSVGDSLCNVARVKDQSCWNLIREFHESLTFLDLNGVCILIKAKVFHTIKPSSHTTRLLTRSTVLA